mmetsp:Transcript_48393/g.89757  ORF Transcript_48393/g.89757 Transcript_48393/m.89757 type:complete len:108 (+) Transcript_48393:1596-1919(+)
MSPIQSWPEENPGPSLGLGLGLDSALQARALVDSSLAATMALGRAPMRALRHKTMRLLLVFALAIVSSVALALPLGFLLPFSATAAAPVLPVPVLHWAAMAPSILKE